MAAADRLKVQIGCDTTELDEALAKLDLLRAKAQQLQQLGVLPVVLAAGAAVEAGQRTVSRRSLLGLRWLFR